ncbi:MAG: hypothetical protein A2148_03445 [Chloroflexi bacterium RBG_16_68_14]|nr:MAG: hypothetical protein A2148_03445 [Chloroflexi bacterium RBG_16_68_14]
MTRHSPRVLVLPLTTIVLTVLLAAGAALFMSVTSAHAEIEGPCGATIAGVDVAGVNSGSRNDDIHVSRHQAVPVGATSAAGFQSHKVQLEFASRRWTVSEQQDNGSTQWSDTVNVDDYARYGVGLYKVVGVSILNDGTTCTGAATVDVDGNPLATVAGGAAAGATALGTVGALASTALGATGRPQLRGPRPPEPDVAQPGTKREFYTRPGTPNILFAQWLLGCWTLAAIALIMVPLSALAGGGAAPGGAPPGAGQPPTSAGAQPAVPQRPIWLPRITLLGLVSGFLAGAGLTVLLQQYSIMYPTLGVIITWVIVGMVVYGVVLPTIGTVIGTLRVRGRVA